MSISVSLTRDPDEWNELLAQSPQRTPFHRFEALQVLSDHSDMPLYPFIGYKGEEPVGLFPVFSVSRGGIRAAFSPPPELKIPYLGPTLLNQENVKQRKAEKRHRRFNEAIFEEVETEISPRYVHLRTGTEYTDPRPLMWDGFDITPRYTYEVEISTPSDELFMTFSSDVRRNIRRTDEESYELSEGGPDDIEEIITRVREYHAEQGVAFNVPPPFASDLYRKQEDGAVRAYVCRSDGAFVGGLLTLEDDRTMYRWQAVNDHEHDVPASDILDWHVIQDARNRGIERYDLVGANNARIAKYKSKFNPSVRIYFALERSTRTTKALRSLYNRLR